jgi:hypothetical protein
MISRESFAPVVFYCTAMLLTIFGSGLMLLENSSINARLPTSGGTIGGLPDVESSWLYHSGTLGFMLAVFSVVIQSAVIFVQWRSANVA